MVFFMDCLDRMSPDTCLAIVECQGERSVCLLHRAGMLLQGGWELPPHGGKHVAYV